MLTDEQVKQINKMCPIAKKYGIGAILQAAQSIETSEIEDGAVTPAKISEDVIVPLTEKPFRVTGSISASAAITPVELLADAEVPDGKKVYVDGFIVNVNGSTAWTDDTGTKIVIEDKAASPANVCEIAKAQLTGNAVLGMFSTGVTLGAAVKQGTGLTAAKGLQVKADDDFTAGSDILVTIWGVIK